MWHSLHLSLFVFHVPDKILICPPAGHCPALSPLLYFFLVFYFTIVNLLLVPLFLDILDVILISAGGGNVISPLALPVPKCWGTLQMRFWGDLRGCTLREKQQ